MFGRVTPHQKQEMVKALQARGHNVKVWPPFTSANSIMVTPQGLAGAADTRTRGALAAFQMGRSP